MFPAARALTLSMFLGSFAWGFAFISLPFYVEAISPYDPGTTLRWAGWILGIPSLVTVLTSPAWGRVGDRGDPRTQYVWVQLFQGVAFMGMALARTLPELFIARLLLGAMGAASTLAFIIAGRQPDPREVRREVAAVQLAMTLGQVLGPLGGAAVAARLGFKPSFVVASVILLGSGAFVHWGVRAQPPAERPQPAAPRGRALDLIVPVALVLAVSNQLFFLPAVLPQVVPGLGVPADSVVEVGGFIVFVSAIATGIGAVMTPRLAALAPERTLLAAVLVASGVLMAATAIPTGVVGFTVVRFLQVLCAAPIFPLVVARTAQQGSGGAIGVINSARIGGSFVGPVVATSILSVSSPTVLYATLGVASLACVPLALWRPRRR
jgi:MFS family permease